MRVAQIVSTFPPYYGGIGNVAYATSLELTRRGYQVTVFTPLYQRTTSSADLSDKARSEAEGATADLFFNVKRLRPLIAYGNAAFTPQLAWQLRNFDVIHLHYPFFGGAEMVALGRRLAPKAKLVITYHMDVTGFGLQRKFFAWHQKYVMPKIINAADLVIGTSLDYLKHSALQPLLARQPNKFMAIPNGVDTEVFTPGEPSSTLRQRHFLTSNDYVVLFVGGLDRAHYFKGVDYLLRALVPLDAHVKCVIVGSGNLETEYLRQTEELGLTDRVIFAGRVSNVELPLYYQLADVVVLPSIDASEAFGITLIEGMAAAKPVIASALPGVRTVVDDGVNGFLVKQQDSVGLSKTIIEVLSDPQLMTRLGQAGRRKAEEEYDWRVIGARLEEAYAHP